jgi:hypothetical protein
MLLINRLITADPLREPSSGKLSVQSKALHIRVYLTAPDSCVPPLAAHKFSLLESYRYHGHFDA